MPARTDAHTLTHIERGALRCATLRPASRKRMSDPSEPESAPAFEPMRDMLGIDKAIPSAQAPAAATMGIGQQATLEHTTADRVAHVKGLMSGAGGGMNPNAQMAMQQQQQAMMAYQTYAGLAAYQTQAANQQMSMQQQQMMAYQTMNAQAHANQQQMVMYQTHQAQPNMMMQRQYSNPSQQYGNNQVALYNPAPQGNQVALVPAMEAQQVSRAPTEYRVQRSSETKRVSDSDVAFGPLIDRLKKAAAEKGAQGKQ